MSNIFGSTTSTTSSHGFLAALNNWLASILDIITSFMHSTLALVQFVFALVHDVVLSVFSIVKGVTATTVNFLSGVTRSVFGLLQGAIGFITANFVTIALLIGAYYLYTSYQRQNRAAPNAPIADKARNTVTDAAGRAREDAQKNLNDMQKGFNTYSEKVKGAFESGQEKVQDRASKLPQKVQN